MKYQKCPGRQLSRRGRWESDENHRPLWVSMLELLIFDKSHLDVIATWYDWLWTCFYCNLFEKSKRHTVEEKMLFRRAWDEHGRGVASATQVATKRWQKKLPQKKWHHKGVCSLFVVIVHCVYKYTNRIANTNAKIQFEIYFSDRCARSAGETCARHLRGSTRLCRSSTSTGPGESWKHTWNVWD